jgi:hypothetical protein
MRKNKLKIIAASAMVIFNLAICFAATFAWFVAKDKLDGSQINMKIEATELNLDYDLYKYDIYQVVSTESFSLNTYDSIIDDKNINTALIMKVTLSGNVFQDRNAIDVNIKVKHGAAPTAQNTDPLSDLVHFRFGQLTSLTSNDPTTIYDGVQENFTSQFLIFGNSDTIEIDLTDATITNNQVIIFGLIDYDKTLVDIKEYNPSNLPDFVDDLEYIRFEVYE